MIAIAFFMRVVLLSYMRFSVTLEKVLFNMNVGLKYYAIWIPIWLLSATIGFGVVYSIGSNMQEQSLRKAVADFTEKMKKNNSQINYATERNRQQQQEHQDLISSGSERAKAIGESMREYTATLDRLGKELDASYKKLVAVAKSQGNFLPDEFYINVFEDYPLFEN